MAYKRRLLVEGIYDTHVVRNLLRYHQIHCQVNKSNIPDNSEAIIIEGREGLPTLLKGLNAILDDGSLEQIGIVIDANSSL